MSKHARTARQYATSVASAARHPESRRETIWRASELAAFAALACLVALVFSTRLQVQFTLPKLFWLQAALPVLGTMWAVRLATGRVRAIPPFTLACSAALVAWWTLTTATAIHLHTAVFGAYGRYNGLATHVMCVGLFWMVASSGLTRAQVETRLRILVVVCLPVAAYALVQYMGWDAFVWPNLRPGSTIGQPVPLAALLGLMLPFAIAWAVSATSVSRALAWGAALSVIVLAIAATLSRGPAIGSLAASALLALAVLLERGFTVRRLAAVGAAGLAAAAVVVAVLMVNASGWNGVLNRVLHPLRDTSFTDRFIFYRVALAIARDHPMLGVGFESYGLLYPRYFTPTVSGAAVDVVPTMVHDGYLQSVVTNGIPALVLYVALVSAVVRLLWGAFHRLPGTRDRLTCAACVSAILSYLVQDASGWLDLSLSVFFWIALGLAVAFCTADVPVRDRRWPALRLVGWVGPWMFVGLTVVGGVALAVRTTRALEADRLIFSALHDDLTRDWPAVSADLARALAAAPDEARYWVDAGIVYLRRLDVTSGHGAYEAGSMALDRAHRLNPFDSDPLVNRIDLDAVAVRRGVIRAASPAAEDAIDALTAADHSSSSVHAAVSRLRLAERNLPDALAAVQRAEALNPSRAGHAALEGDVWRELGDKGAAIAAYRRELARSRSDVQAWWQTERKLILNLIETAQYEAAIAEGQAVSAAGTRDALTEVLLGFAYRALARGDQAREAFSAALRLDPQNVDARRGLEEMNRAIRSR